MIQSYERHPHRLTSIPTEAQWVVLPRGCEAESEAVAVPFMVQRSEFRGAALEKSARPAYIPQTRSPDKADCHLIGESQRPYVVA